ncbi:pectinesterase inhibitor 3-like [Wolffia australiana]
MAAPRQPISALFLLLSVVLAAAAAPGVREARSAASAAAELTGGAAAYVAGLLREARGEAGALKDCKGLLGEAAELLENAAAQLRGLRGEDVAWRVDNALTWASAALTNQDTCLQGLNEVKAGTSPEARAEVVRRVSGASRATSSALLLINRLV